MQTLLSFCRKYMYTIRCWNRPYRVGVDLEKATRECCQKLKLRCMYHTDWNEHRCIISDDNEEIDFIKIEKLSKPVRACCIKKGADATEHNEFFQSEATEKSRKCKG